VIIFDIPGKPFAKQRHRVGAIRGRARAFNTAANERFEDVVRTIAAPMFPAPVDGPVALEVVAVFAPPASWSKRKRAAMLGKPHVQRPDADNIAKAVKDGLNRIAWGDDAQVCDLRVQKRWGEADGTIVRVQQA
jgi:Holliday junction resolvase RusA-like endonuclease